MEVFVECQIHHIPAVSWTVAVKKKDQVDLGWFVLINLSYQGMHFYLHAHIWTIPYTSTICSKLSLFFIGIVCSYTSNILFSRHSQFCCSPFDLWNSVHGMVSSTSLNLLRWILLKLGNFHFSLCNNLTHRMIRWLLPFLPPQLDRKWSSHHHLWGTLSTLQPWSKW